MKGAWLNYIFEWLFKLCVRQLALSTCNMFKLLYFFIIVYYNNGRLRACSYPVETWPQVHLIVLCIMYIIMTIVLNVLSHLLPSTSIKKQTDRGSRHHTSSDPAHTREMLRCDSNRSSLSALIGCSTDAAAFHWLRGVPFKPNSIAVVLEIWRQMCPMWWVIWGKVVVQI